MEAICHLEIEPGTGSGQVPSNLATNPTGVTVDGVVATYVARVDANETAQRYWVKVTVPQSVSYTSAVVTFADNPNNGTPRVFDSVQIVTAP